MPASSALRAASLAATMTLPTSAASVASSAPALFHVGAGEGVAPPLVFCSSTAFAASAANWFASSMAALAAARALAASAACWSATALAASAGDETESGIACGSAASGARALAASPAAKGFFSESGIGGGSRLGWETDSGIAGTAGPSSLASW